MSRRNRALKAARDNSSWALTFDHLMDFGNVSPFIQTLLRDVYFTLFGALTFMSIGYGLNIYANRGGVVTILGIIGSSAWFWRTDPWREAKRSCLLMVIGFCIGVSLDRLIGLLATILKGAGPLIGPLIRMDKAVARLFGGASLGALIKLFIRVDQRNILFALIGNAITFGIFGLAAQFSPRTRRVVFYMLSALWSIDPVVFALVWAGSVDLLMIYNFIWFARYVVAYSQEIVVQARCGNCHYTQHAVALYPHMIPFTFNLGRILVSRLLPCLRNLIPRI